MSLFVLVKVDVKMVVDKNKHLVQEFQYVNVPFAITVLDVN
jgi:hypothetical protein